MALNIVKEVAALRKMTVAQLVEKFVEVCGEGTRTRNKDWLVKRIAWRMQANEEGGLSERARKRAMELADDRYLRLTAPKEMPLPAKPATQVIDDRLPPPGNVITRTYKGEELQITVLADGFEWEGVRFDSLSAVAKAITGSHCNGYLFFGLAKRGAK